MRNVLKSAAFTEGCDFPGFGTHSLRRANITMRQEVGGSSIETSQIAGHANTKITEEYTIVQLRRQDELTRRIQAKRLKAGKRGREKLVSIQRTDTGRVKLLEPAEKINRNKPGSLDRAVEFHLPHQKQKRISLSGTVCAANGRRNQAKILTYYRLSAAWNETPKPFLWTALPSVTLRFQCFRKRKIGVF